MDNLDLSHFFQTKAQANDFSARLATISEQTYTTNFNLEKILMEQIGITKKDTFMALLRDNQINPESASALKAFIEKIQAKITSLPIVPITLAFEPRQQTLQTLSDWFLLNINQQVLFAITVDKRLLGGAAITYNGKFMDFSIKPKLEKIINDTIAGNNEKKAAPAASDKHQAGDQLHIGR